MADNEFHPIVLDTFRISCATDALMKILSLLPPVERLAVFDETRRLVQDLPAEQMAPTHARLPVGHSVSSAGSAVEMPLAALKAWDLISTRTYSALVDFVGSPDSPFPAGISAEEVGLALLAPLSLADLLTIPRMGATSLFDLVEAMSFCVWKLHGTGASRLYEPEQLTGTERYHQRDARRRFRKRQERLQIDRRMTELSKSGTPTREIGVQFGIYDHEVRARIARYRK